MNEQIWQEVTGKEPLTEEELDKKRKEIIGEGLDGLDDEWLDLLKFIYNIGEYEKLPIAEELGATTTIAIVPLPVEDVDSPDLNNQKLFGTMLMQENYVGEVARYIHEDDSISFHSATKARKRDGIVELAVWA